LDESWIPAPEPPWQKDLEKIPTLLAELDEKDSAVQLGAIQELSKLGSYAALAFQKLFKLMKSDELAVRRAAMDAMERVPPDKDDLRPNQAAGWPGLVRVCTDGEEAAEVRVQALKSLARLGTAAKSAVPQLAEQFKNADTTMRRQIMVTMVAIGPEARELSLLRESLKSTEPEIGRLAAEGLTTLGPQAKPALKELTAALKSRDARMRLAALRAIEATGETKAAVPSLVDLLKDSDREVSLAAAGAMVSLGEYKEAMPVLKDTFKRGTPLARRQVCRLLGLVGGTAKPAAGNIAKTAIEDLIDVLGDPKVRTVASNALIKVGKPAADIIAGKMTKIEDDRARLECVYILGQIGHTSNRVGWALWVIARSDPQDENQEEAWKVISKLTGGNVTPSDVKKGIGGY
jgi:HEAT repeat protein